MEDAIFIEIQHLCQIVKQRGLNELSINRPDFSLSLTAVPTAVPATAGAVPHVVHAPVHPPVPSTVEPEAIARNEYAITSPLIGIFYSAPSPDAPNFVEIGDAVEVGQTIGIVEAMKVFNEITTDRAGIVIAIPVEKGKLVQVDEPLVIIEPSM